MIKFKTDSYLEMPQLNVGKLVMFYGREDGVDIPYLLDREIPPYLWILNDNHNSERNLYFLDEPSLHYFISENIGDDIHHTRAKVLRRNGSSFLKRRIHVNNPDHLQIKDFDKISLDNNFTVDEISIISKVVKLPSNRLKEQKDWKELSESKG